MDLLALIDKLGATNATVICVVTFLSSAFGIMVWLMHHHDVVDKRCRNELRRELLDRGFSLEEIENHMRQTPW